MKRLRWFSLLVISAVLANCAGVPGRPTEQDRFTAPSEVTNFDQLYSVNCSGCHGVNGRMGPAQPLNDPLYLAITKPDDLAKVTANGVSGTSMPGFAKSAGGTLTDKQIGLLVDGIRTQWSHPDQFNGVALPPYNAQDAGAGGSGAGSSQRGALAYQTYCLQCHGPDGRGGRAGSIIDPNYLQLVSNQSLRTRIITGRPDLGKPDWRSDVPGKPMSPQEITDLVEWLAGQRSASEASIGISNARAISGPLVALRHPFSASKPASWLWLTRPEKAAGKND